MEKLLIEAEKIIQMNTPPRVCQLYNNKKREILFGPFSDIILTYQNDNKKLTEQLDKKTSEKQPKYLQSYIKKSIISIITGQLNTKIKDDNKNLNELENLLLEIVQKQENEKRKNIQRYRNNIIKYNKKIEESKKFSIHKSPPPADNRTQLSQVLKKTQTNLNMMKKNLKNMKSENDQFSSKMAKLQSFIQKKSRESEEKKDNYEKLKTKIQDLNDYKEKLKAELIMVNENVQKTILIQRFGPGILTEGKMPKIDEIMKLKKEILQLKEEKEILENKKKDKIINSIKQSQRNNKRPLVSPNA